MQLKVGELARRTGLTVRTLHHYDTMGLLVPSARTDAGYRLYNRDDIARLHAIQALRQIGMPLAEIVSLLDGAGEPLPQIIERQLGALDHQIAKASELRTHLGLLQTQLGQGNEPDMGTWLATLESMSTYGRYFTATELKKIIDNWKRVESELPPLRAAILDAMQRKMPPDSLEIQPLARHWMDLNNRWMEGDFSLMERWGKMYAQEPAAQGRNGMEPELVNYIEQAAALRRCALFRHFTMDELKRLNVSLENEWQAFSTHLRNLVLQKPPLNSPQAQAAVHTWSSLIDRTVNHDPALREKFLNAYCTDALLQAGSILDSNSRDYIRAAWMANEAMIASPPNNAFL